MSNFKKVILCISIFPIYAVAASDLPAGDSSFSLLKIANGVEWPIAIKDSRLLAFLKSKIIKQEVLDDNLMNEFALQINPEASIYKKLLLRYKLIEEEVSGVDEVYRANDELKALSTKLLEQRDALFTKVKELASSESGLKQEVESLLSLKDKYDKEIAKLEELRGSSEGEKRQLYGLLNDLSSSYQNLDFKLEALRARLENSDHLENQPEVIAKEDLEAISRAQDTLLSRLETLQEHHKSNIALELEKDDLKIKLAERDSVLSALNHPVTLSVAFVSAIFVGKKIFDFTMAKLFYGAKPLKQFNENRIRKIIQEHTGKTFDQLKIRIKTPLGNKFSYNVSYLQTYNEQFLFIASNSFIESLSDDELKYVILRELLFVSYNYELKKLIRSLVIGSVLSGVASKLVKKNSMSNKYIALYAVIISELIFYGLDLSSKIKDDLYIDNFGTIDDLNGAISYYKKIYHSRYIRNKKISFFKLAIAELFANKIKRIL